MHSPSIAVVLSALASLFASASAQGPTASCPSGQYALVDASQRPDTRNCGTFGELDAPSPLGPPRRAASTDVCVQICKSTSGCVSFGFAKNAGSCVLYNKRLIDMQYRDRTTRKGTVFANQLCYRCVPCPADAIQNGGFEQGSGENATDWTLDDPSNSQQDGGPGYVQRVNRTNGPSFYNQGFVHSGKYSLFLGYDYFNSNSTELDPPVRALQPLRCLSPGKPYELSFWTSTYSAAKLDLQFDGKSVFHYNCADSRDACGELIQVTATVTPRSPTPTLGIVSVPENTVGTWIDDVSMRLVQS